MQQKILSIKTNGREIKNISDVVRDTVHQLAKTKTGLCHLFLQHTSASLIICENADPAVRYDLEVFFSRLIPDGDPRYTHTAEGDDDMPAHLRTILTQSSLTIPICAGELALGTWQGIYLWEHRLGRYERTLIVTCED